jgi:5'-3' exonuclease
MSKLLLIDADTILYAAASQQQTNKCLATNIEQGRKKMFESKTAFNSWAKENNRDKTNYSFETVSEISGEPRFAFQTIKQKIDNIVSVADCSDYRVCIQGDGNFRKFYESKFVDYKGQRGAKPLLFQECFDYMVKKYKDRCVVSVGQETDDYVNIEAWESYNVAKKARKQEEATVVVSYVDKDIPANGRGFFLNYNKLDAGVFWQDEFNQAKEFWTQVLVGDNADNIPGLEVLSSITKERFKVKTTSVGPVAAQKILDGLKTEKQMAERVAECYSASHEEDWEQRLQDNCFFLYLRRKPDEMFNVWEYMETLK